MGGGVLNLGSRLNECPPEQYSPDRRVAGVPVTHLPPTKEAIAFVSLLLTDGAYGRARETIFKLTVLLFSTKLKHLLAVSSEQSLGVRSFTLRTDKQLTARSIGRRFVPDSIASQSSFEAPQTNAFAALAN